MKKTQHKKLLLFLLILIAVVIAVYCYQNRYTQTEESYTFTQYKSYIFTNYIYKNDNLDVKVTCVMNEYGDTLQMTHEWFFSDDFRTSSCRYYYYKYDKYSNKTLCIKKDEHGNLVGKERFKYDKNHNCIFHKYEGTYGYYTIDKTDYNDKNLKIRNEYESHDSKVDLYNISEYYYDDKDRLIKEINNKQNGWSTEKSYEYDDNGLPIHIVEEYIDDDLISEKEFEYNDSSELISITEIIYRENEEDSVYKTCYTYNQMGEKISETHTENGIKNKQIIYEYDVNSNLVSQSEYEYFK